MSYRVNQLFHCLSISYTKIKCLCRLINSFLEKRNNDIVYDYTIIDMQ
jgi:hypothetical protein